jgi:phosphinothricin acetyltransferase
MSEDIIRPIEDRDLPALLAIYNHYVLNTPITFDIEPKTLDNRRQWFAGFARSGRFRCFVAERKGQAVGWAASGRFKERAAYDTSVELGIYLAPDAHRQGLGRCLYQTLIDALQGEDVHRLYGGITLPNAASVALHEAMGFRRIGVQNEVGRKFGKFWDVGLYERLLRLP